MSLKNIAKETGFSVTTVSRALNDHDDVSAETKRIIKEAAERLNYVPNLNARRLATRNNRRIGFVILKFGDASGEDNFMYEVFRGISQSSNHLDYETVLIPVTSDEINDDPDFLHNIARKNALSAVVLMGIEKNTQYYQELQKIKIPVVCIDGDIENSLVGRVSIDNEIAFYEMTKRLLAKTPEGNEPLNYIFMSGREDTIAGFYRYRGFKKAIQEAERHIISELCYGDYSEKKSYEIISSFLKQGVQIDGIVCANDMMAIGASKAILENRRSIPRDIQISGCDNISLSQYTDPSISTISVDKYRIGYKAVELVNSIKQKDETSRSIIIPHELILRESTL